MKRKFIITIACAITALLGNAQAFRATYSYDDNGNRIGCKIVYINASSNTPLKSYTEADSSTGNISTDLNESTDLQNSEWSTPDVTQMGATQVQLYPNPTRGLMKLCFNNFPDETVALRANTIQVYDMSGKLVIVRKGIETINIIDLKNQPGGEYFMKVKIGTQQINYQIIKTE